jgi:hypothetical protein
MRVSLREAVWLFQAKRFLATALLESNVSEVIAMRLHRSSRPHHSLRSRGEGSVSSSHDPGNALAVRGVSKELDKGSG